MPIAKTAFIDESLRIHAGLYVLATVIVADADADGHRQALRDLLHRRQLRLHWRDESATRRKQLISAVCQLRHTGAVVIATGVAPRRQERARRKCIERLLTELTSRGIASIVFERRHDELDARGARAIHTASGPTGLLWPLPKRCPASLVVPSSARSEGKE